MKAALADRIAYAERTRVNYEFERASYRVRTIKILCGILLGICFWYSVPYYLPLKIDPNPKKAAANEAAAYEGNFSRQVAMPIIALTAAYLLWRMPKRGRFGSRLMPIAIGYISWAILSAGWSGDPSITRKRLIVFAINAFFAFMIARVCSMDEMALFGFAQTGIVALISLYVEVLQERKFAPLDPDYRFNGVMTANYQAMNLVMCMICAMTLLHKRPHWLRWIAPVMGVGLVLLYLTRSRLGTILGLVLLAVLIFRYARHNLKPQARGLLLVASFAVIVPTLIFTVGRNGGGGAVQNAFMMGRKDTENTSNLSNRAPLWAELMESVHERPWLGYGYEAFWTPERVERVSADQGWMVPHAHDTYLDQTLSLGLIGMLLYIGLLWGGAGMAWRRFKRKPSAESLFPALLLTWVALTGVAESVPVDPYLPTLLAYTCLVKMSMVEGSEEEIDSRLGDELIHGLPMQAIAPLPGTEFSQQVATDTRPIPPRRRMTVL